MTKTSIAPLALQDIARAPKALTKGERTRQNLLTVAAAKFAQHGFERTRIADIVAKARVTQPVFYRYFNNKQAAYNELVNLFAQRLRQAIRAARLPDDLPPVQIDARIRSVLRTLFDILQEDPDLTRIGFCQSDKAEILKGELSAMIATNVRAEQAAGFFRPDVSPILFAESLIAILERFTRQLLDGAQRQVLANFMTDLLLDGLRMPAGNRTRP